MLLLRMNERDYNLIEYCTIVAGFCLIAEWLAISMLFNLPFTPIGMIFYIIIGIVTMLISIIAHFKKILYVQEMKGYLKEGKNGEMERNPAQKLS